MPAVSIYDEPDEWFPLRCRGPPPAGRAARTVAVLPGRTRHFLRDQVVAVRGLTRDDLQPAALRQPTQVLAEKSSRRSACASKPKLFPSWGRFQLLPVSSRGLEGAAALRRRSGRTDSGPSTKRPVHAVGAGQGAFERAHGTGEKPEKRTVPRTKQGRPAADPPGDCKIFIPPSIQARPSQRPPRFSRLRGPANAATAGLPPQAVRKLGVSNVGRQTSALETATSPLFVRHLPSSTARSPERGGLAVLAQPSGAGWLWRIA